MIKSLINLKSLIKKRGISERQLATLTKLSRNRLRAIGQPNENYTLTSLEKLADFFKKDVTIFLDEPLANTSYSVIATSIFINHDGLDSWKIHLMNFVDEFRSTLDMRLILLPPVNNCDEKIRALISSTTLALCEEANISPPTWATMSCFLKRPWFVAGIESLKAMAILESPISFRKNNIFVLSNFLSRA